MSVLAIHLLLYYGFLSKFTYTINNTRNDTFFSSDRNMTKDSVKYYDQAKYEAKLLVWVAISPAGISDCFIVPSKLAVTREVYLEEFLVKRLLPFIKIYHRDAQYVFWSDMASSHYANSVYKITRSHLFQNLQMLQMCQKYVL